MVAVIAIAVMMMFAMVSAVMMVLATVLAISMSHVILATVMTMMPSFNFLMDRLTGEPMCLFHHFRR